MKTFRFIGMALFAILMCVNLSSCSSSDDDPTEEKEEGGVVVSGKKITKIVGTGVFKNVTYTFKYDDKLEGIWVPINDNKGFIQLMNNARNKGSENYREFYNYAN